MRSGFAEHVSAVGTLGDALDGTPIKRKRAAAKKPDPNSSVSTAVRCECGDQFDDFRNAWLHVYQGHCEVLTNIGELRRADGQRLVAACGTNSGYYRHLKQGNGSVACVACLEARNEHRREARFRKMRDDPQGYEQQVAHGREWRKRRMADPEYRERKRAYSTTPEYREKAREYVRRHRARKKAEQKVTADS